MRLNRLLRRFFYFLMNRSAFFMWLLFRFLIKVWRGLCFSSKLETSMIGENAECWVLDAECLATSIFPHWRRGVRGIDWWSKNGFVHRLNNWVMGDRCFIYLFTTSKKEWYIRFSTSSLLHFFTSPFLHFSISWLLIFLYSPYPALSGLAFGGFYTNPRRCHWAELSMAFSQFFSTSNYWFLISNF